MQISYSYTAEHHVQITTLFGLPKITAMAVLSNSTFLASTGIILGNPKTVVICTWCLAV
jgi:hypothetical protein